MAGKKKGLRNLIASVGSSIGRYTKKKETSSIRSSTKARKVSLPMPDVLRSVVSELQECKPREERLRRMKSSSAAAAPRTTRRANLSEVWSGLGTGWETRVDSVAMARCHAGLVELIAFSMEQGALLDVQLQLASTKTIAAAAATVARAANAATFRSECAVDPEIAAMTAVLAAAAAC